MRQLEKSDISAKRAHTFIAIHWVSEFGIKVNLVAYNILDYFSSSQRGHLEEVAYQRIKLVSFKSFLTFFFLAKCLLCISTSFSKIGLEDQDVNTRLEIACFQVSPSKL